MLKFKRTRSGVGAALIAALFAGCGGGGSSVPAALSAASTTQSTSVNISLKVPLRKSSSGNSRRPQYISPATQSVTVTVGGSPFSFNTNATSPNCAFPVTESYNAYEPTQLALASDGTMWFANEGGSAGHMAPGGTLMGTPILSNGDALISIGAGASGTVWAGHYYGNPNFNISHVGYGLSPQYSNISVTPPAYISSEALGSDGNMYFSYLDESVMNTPPAATIGRIIGLSYDGNSSWTAASGVGRIVSGLDGSIWFTETNGSIGHLTFPGPVLNEIVTGSTGVVNAGAVVFNQIGITINPSDGSVYFAKFSSTSPLTFSAIGHLDSSGNALTDIPVPAGVGAPYGLTVGPDGAIWIANGLGTVGRITTGGVYTTYPTPLGNTAAGGNSTVLDVATGSDGNVYFTERTGGYVGYVQMALQCTGSTVAAPGTNIPVTVKTYDMPGGAGGGGNVLGVTNSTATISPNGVTNLSFTLGGVVKSVVASANPNSLSGCSNAPHTSTITVTALDADNNVIVGPGNFADASGNPITVTLTGDAMTSAIGPPSTFTQGGSTSASFNPPVAGGTSTILPSVNQSIAGSIVPATVNFSNCS